MRLRTRLTIGGSLVVGIMAIGIASTALVSAENSEQARLDQSLSRIANAARAAGSGAVNKALAISVESPVEVALAIVTTDGDFTVINDAELDNKQAPSTADLQRALTTDVEVNLPQHYLIRTVSLKSDGYLVVATSLAAVDSNRSANLTKFAWLTLIAILLAGVALRFIIRRDLRVIDSLIEVAEDISEGDVQAVIPTRGGDSEVDQLAASLQRMVATLQHSLEVEQETQQRMQQFLGDASHELRTPLTVIRGYVELLSHSADLPVDQRERAFNRLTSEIQRMESLIRDLLLLAELGDAAELPADVVDLSGLVTTAVEDLRALEPKRVLTAEIADQVKLLGSEHLLQQLLANLFGNLRRHTPADAPVRVTLAAQGEQLRLSVEDGGPGLSDAALQRGIQHFQRFDAARSRESGGSGLGMSIMAGIVERHGGQIRLGRSDLGGLAVEITLPRA